MQPWSVRRGLFSINLFEQPAVQSDGARESNQQLIGTEEASEPAPDAKQNTVWALPSSWDFTNKLWSQSREPLAELTSGDDDGAQNQKLSQNDLLEATESWQVQRVEKSRMNKDSLQLPSSQSPALDEKQVTSFFLEAAAAHKDFMFVYAIAFALITHSRIHRIVGCGDGIATRATNTTPKVASN